MITTKNGIASAGKLDQREQRIDAHGQQHALRFRGLRLAKLEVAAQGPESCLRKACRRRPTVHPNFSGKVNRFMGDGQTRGNIPEVYRGPGLLGKRLDQQERPPLPAQNAYA